MSEREEKLARLRVAVTTGRLPRDLGAWVLRQLEPLDRDARDDALRAAAACVGGSRWQQARAIAELVTTIRTLPGYMYFVFGEGTPARHVQDALRLDPETPDSIRQMLRILVD